MRRCLTMLVCSLIGTAWGCGDSEDGSNPAMGGASTSGGKSAGGSEQSAGRGGAGGNGGATTGSAGSATAGNAGEATSNAGRAGEGGATAETLALKVLTFNSPSFPSALAAQDILDSGADVVGLQETSPQEAAEICAALGEPWTFVQEDRVGTHAIVSKLPILQRIGVTKETRGGIGATILVAPGVHAHLFDTHGMYTPYGPYQLGLDGMSVEDVIASEEAVRMPGVSELLELAAPYIESGETTFLVGDFNAPSHLDYEPAVPWPTSVAPLEAGLVDSYAELHPDNAKKSACEFKIDDPGITWTQLPASEPDGCFDRIDFIYYSKNDAVPMESHTIDVKASDHRAVLTTFEVSVPASAMQAKPQIPANSATGVSRHALLTWVPGANAISEELLIGSGAPDVKVANAGPGHHLTGLLAASTTYAWRIDTVTPSGTVSGNVRMFTTKSSGGLEPDKATYAPGSSIQIQFDGGNNVTDWIGLYPRSAAYGQGSPATVWKYLNDSGTAPAAAVQSGDITLTAPVAPGAYALRFFDADGYAVEDEVGIEVK